MKKILFAITILISVTILFFALGTTASAETYGDLTYKVTDGEVAITGCSKSATEVEIPATISGYPVTSIGNNAFFRCYSLQEIIIPDSVTSIGNCAFYECKELKKVTLGNSLKTIGYQAFHLCFSLTDIVIPDSTTTIGNYAFYHCENLTSVNLGKNLTEIGCLAFSLCFMLENISVNENNEYYSSDEYGVLFNKDKTELIQYPIGNRRVKYTIPDSVTTIGPESFSCCSSLINITIPDSVKIISSDAFSSCKSLVHVTIPESVTSIDYEAFAYCSGLEKITILNPECSIFDDWYSIYGDTRIFGYKNSTAQKHAEKYGYTFISIEESDNEILNYITFEINNGEVTITDCNELISGEVVIPDTINGYPVTSIGYDAFSWCEKIKIITIPDSITTIENYAFNSCSNLAIISIGKGVTTIGDGSFFQCWGIADITVVDNNEYYSSDENGVLFNKDKTELIQYPVGNRSAEYIIPDSVTEVCDSSFHNSDNLSNVMIPDSVRTIGRDAFFSCDSIKNITIPHSVTTIGDNAFSACFVKSIVVDKNNPNYSSDEYEVLFNKDKTELIQYPVGNRRIEYIIPDSVTEIDDMAFYCCDNLTDVIVPDSVTIIDYSAFSGCDNLATIKIVNPDCLIYDNEYTIAESTTIYGYPCSTAQDYADNHARTFISLCNHNTEPVITLPTCIEQGYTTYSCVECDYLFKRDYVDLIAHDYKKEESILPTCTQSGYTKYSCSVCGNSYNDNFISATEHDYKAEIIAPTCTEKGYTIYTCFCGLSYIDDYVNANGHDYKKEVTAPTCTEKGYTTYTCFCGLSYIDDYVDAEGHDYTTVVTAPTCTEKGYTTYTCFCGFSDRLDFVLATGHTAGEWKVVVDAQVGVEGKEQQKCTVCGEVVDERVIAALPDITFIPGDANGDGEITASDARIALRISAGLETLEGANTTIAIVDFNADGEITASDARKILRKSAGLE